MRKSWLVCALLGALAWGQAAPGTPPGNAAKPEGPTAPPDAAASIAPDAAVLTINGVCPEQTAASQTPSPDCKTIVTKAEFEKLANGIAPNMTPQLRRQLANILPRLIAMSSQAKEKGLENTPRYEETLKFAKMQILTNELQRSIQEDASKISQDDIESYYKEHPETFEQFTLERLFVPRTKQGDDEEKEEAEDKDQKDTKLTEAQQKAKQAKEKAEADEAEQTMAKLAQSLRDRAAAGEDFVKLQKEAFAAAGMKIESPTVSLPKVRRNALPPAHVTVFDLKAGEVSQVIHDSGGHYIYKVVSEDHPTLDQVKEEIHNTLQTERTRAAMDKVNGSFKVETNNEYFGIGGPETMPPPRAPHPHMVPGPTSPSPTPAKPN